MNVNDLREYLYRHIPISSAMQIEVIHASIEEVVLSAPLAPNINHRDTVFGGSASALAIFSAWSLLHLRARYFDMAGRLVIQSNHMHYDAPIAGTFQAVCKFDDAVTWERFTRMYKRHGRARIEVKSELEFANSTAGRFEGEFVLFD